MKRQAAIFVVISILIAAVSVCFVSANGAPDIIPGSELTKAAGGPPCTGRNPNVAMPSAPHGMYAWAPGPRMTALLKKYVIGKDPSLCGASIVVPWAVLEKSKGVYNFSPAEQLAKPFTDAGLTVNFLFSDATEGKDQVTPQWVLNEVPTSSCGTEGGKLPVYWNPKFEADWSALIKHAIDYFSNTSPIRSHVGYLRFALGGGAEAVPLPGGHGGKCADAVKKLGFSYDVWKKHVFKILDVMGSEPTKRQIICALPEQAGGKTKYELTNEFAKEAAKDHVGLSFESLGGNGETAPGTKPGRCDPNGKLHWCEAYQKYAGTVPLAMQPMTATRNTNVGNIDISNLLQYAIDNKIQIFELYPDEFLEANGAKEWQRFEPAKQAKYKAALQAASRVLGQAPIQ